METMTVDQMIAHSYAPFSVSPTLGKLADALAKAQAGITGAAKDRTNPHFGSKYATLDACWDACRKALSANGLAVVQLPSSDGSKVSVTTVLAHASGEWISSMVTMVAKDGTPQSIGSALTYGRRYGLCAAVGVAPEEDDDGNGAQPDRATNGRSTPAPPRPASAATGPVTVTDVAFKDGTTNGRKWRKFTVTFSDGSKGGTLNAELGAAASSAKAKALPVRPLLKSTAYGHDLEALDIVRESAPDVVPPEPAGFMDIPDDQVPF